MISVCGFCSDESPTLSGNPIRLRVVPIGALALAACGSDNSSSAAETAAAVATDAAVTGDPGIHIVSPAPGDVVSGDFEVVVEVDDFELNCDLYGKPGLIEIGHYHMNLDTTDG